MRVLGRTRLRHRAPRAVAATPRGSLVLELPEAPDGRMPAPLTLPLIHGGPRWGISADDASVFLATLDVAPPGAVLDVQHCGSGMHVAAAAVYSTRLVRALVPDGERAHATRQAAATNALPVVVEERTLARGPGRGPARPSTRTPRAPRSSRRCCAWRTGEGASRCSRVRASCSACAVHGWCSPGSPACAHRGSRRHGGAGLPAGRAGGAGARAASESAYRRRLAAWQAAWEAIGPSTGQLLGQAGRGPSSGSTPQPAVIDLRDCEGVVS